MGLVIPAAWVIFPGQGLNPCSLCHQEIPSRSLLNGDGYGYKAQGMFPAIFAHEGKESGCSEEGINKKLRQKL